MAKEQENDIDSLARMIADGFSSLQKDMEERFDEAGKEMNERFDAVDKRFDGLEKEVRQINQRIDKVVIPELDSHATRIKDLEVHTGIHA